MFCHVYGSNSCFKIVDDITRVIFPAVKRFEKRSILSTILLRFCTIKTYIEVYIVNLRQLDAEFLKYFFLFVKFLSRHFENALWEAIYPQILYVNILICYEDICGSQKPLLLTSVKNYEEWHTRWVGIVNYILDKCGGLLGLWAIRRGVNILYLPSSL